MRHCTVRHWRTKIDEEKSYNVFVFAKNLLNAKIYSDALSLTVRHQCVIGGDSTVVYMCIHIDVGVRISIGYGHYKTKTKTIKLAKLLQNSKSIAILETVLV